jgi:hypothetical protein
MARGPSAYKGIPRSEWGKVREQREADAALAPHAEVPRETIMQDTESNVDFNVPVAPPQDRPKAPPRNLFSGDIKQLEVFGIDGTTRDPIPGFRLYWFTDTANSGVRIQQAKISGWEMVQAHEIALNDGLTPGNADLGANVRKVVSVDNGNPIYAYLMKKPVWMDKLHQEEHEQKANMPVERALRRGQLPGARSEDRQYVAQPGSNLPPIDIGTKTYR